MKKMITNCLFSSVCNKPWITFTIIIMVMLLVLPLGATTPYIAPEAKIMLKQGFKEYKQQLKDDLIDDLDVDYTNGLYIVQIKTQPLLTYAVEMKDISLMSDLADIYLAAYSYLQTKDCAIYPFWTEIPTSNVDCVRDIVDSSGNKISVKMWLDEPVTIDGETLGKEYSLYVSQFLYALSKLCNGILDIPANDRTTTMNTFINNYKDVILEYYDRWLFSANGRFQVYGWGGPKVLYNHQDFLEAKYDGTLYDANVSYMDAVTDIDIWIIAGLVNYLAANNKDSTLIPINQSLINKFQTYLGTAVDLIESRMSSTSLTDFDGNPVTGMNFDYGAWYDHPDRKYAGYTGSINPYGTAANRTDTGWDFSHARRFVEVFNTLHKNLNITGKTFPSTTDMQKLTNQVIYSAFNKDFDEPMFSNYICGGNGWYLVESSTEGYAPDDMSLYFVDGGYAIWSQYNSDMKLIRDTVWEKLSSLYASDVSGNFKHLFVPSLTSYGVDSPCEFANYLEFDINTSLNVVHDDSLKSSTGTIELWFKTDPSSTMDLINISESTYTDFFLIRTYANNTVKLLICDNNSYVTNLVTTDTYTPNEWTHLAIVQDGTSAKIYLNGELANVTGTNSSSWTSTFSTINSLFIGESAWNKYIGAMDGIHFYSKALTANEISHLASRSQIIAHWSFDVNESCVTNTATSTTGVVGDGVSFDGTQKISANIDQAISSQTGSISLWFKADPNGIMDLVNISESTWTDYLLIRTYADNTVKLLIRDNDSFVTNLATSDTYTPNEWTHLAVVQDGTSAKIYLNGKLANVSGTNSTYWTNNLTINTVLFGESAWNNYVGQMDEIKIHCDAMSANEVSREAGRKSADFSFDKIGEKFTIFNASVNSDGKISSAAEFDGIDQYVRLTAYSAMSSKKGSISFWCKPDSLGRQEPLVYIFENAYEDYLLIRKTSDNKIMLLIEDGNSQKLYLITNQSINNTSWNHIVITQDGTAAKIYINGVLSSLSYESNSGYWTDHLAINTVFLGRSYWAPYYYDGSIDEFKMYGYALSETEISIENKRPDMLMGWDFDDGNGSFRTFINDYYYLTYDDFDNSFYMTNFLSSFIEK